MTTEILGTVGIIALIAAMVGAYIALMVWDWRKKRAQARLEAGAKAWGKAFEAMAHTAPPKPSARQVAAAQ